MSCCCKVIKEPIQFQIGDGNILTPIAGSNTYSNPSIKYDKYLVFRNGEGILFEIPDYTRLSQGGIQLTGTDVFTSSEKFTFVFYN